MLRILAADLMLALGDHDPNVVHYLDRETGGVIPVFNGLFGRGDPEYLDPEQLDEDPRYLPVVPVDPSEAFRWREQFALGVDVDLKRALFDALGGRRPFRRFRDVLLGHPAARMAWYEFEEARLLEAARDWLRLEGIEAELVSPAAVEAAGRVG